MMNSTLSYLFQSGLSLSVLYLVYWLFLKRETFFKLNRFYLLVLPLISFVIPLIKIKSPFKVTYPLENTGVSETLSQPIHAIQLADILLWIYLLGLGLFLVRFLIQSFHIFHIVRKNPVRKYAGHRIILVNRPISPFSFFHFIFIHRTSYSEYELQRIVEHELVHVRQNHSIDILLMECFVIIQWFNPFVWPYKRALKETHEYLADAGVIAQGCDRVEYQMLILKQFVGDKLFAFANSFHQSQIKRRITMMTKNKSKKMAQCKALLILPILSLLLLSFAQPRLIGKSDQKTGSPSLVVQTPQQEKVKSLTEGKSEQSQKELEKKKAYIKKVWEKLDQEIVKTKKVMADAESDEERIKLEEDMKKLKIKKEQLAYEMEALKEMAVKEGLVKSKISITKEKMAKEMTQLNKMSKKLQIEMKMIDEKIATTESMEMKKELKLKRKALEKETQALKQKMVQFYEFEKKKEDELKKKSETIEM